MQAENEENSAEEQGKVAKPKKRKKTTSRLIKLTAYTFLVVGLVVAALQAAFFYYADEILGTALKTIVYQRSGQVYRLRYDDLKLNFLLDELSATNLRLFYNSQRVRELQDRQEAPNQLVKVDIPFLVLRGLDLRDIYIDEEIHLDEIMLENPQFRLIKLRNKIEEQETDQEQHQEKTKGINRFIQQIDIDAIRIVNGDVVLENVLKNLEAPLHLRNINFDLSQIRLDSTAIAETGLPVRIGSVDMDLRSNRIDLPDNKGSLYIGELGMSTAQQLLFIRDLEFTPNTDDRLSFTLPELFLD